MKRSLRQTSVAGLAVVLAGGAVAQLGVVVPHFTSSPWSCADNASTCRAIDNDSLRSWTVSDLRLSNGRTTAPFALGGTATAELYTTSAPGATSVSSVTLAPGHELFVGVSVDPSCTRTRTRPSSAPPTVDVSFSVATPLGSRTFTYPVTFPCTVTSPAGQG
jgi:hypothetical protein